MSLKTYLSMFETKKLPDFGFQELAHEIFHTVLSMISLIQREKCHTFGEGIHNINSGHKNSNMYGTCNLGQKCLPNRVFLNG